MKPAFTRKTNYPYHQTKITIIKIFINTCYFSFREKYDSFKTTFIAFGDHLIFQKKLNYFFAKKNV